MLATAGDAVVVGGLQVLVRATVGGLRPVALDLSVSFAADVFRAATRTARARADAEGVPLYVSVVPTQLGRLSAADLAAYDGVLVGSAAAPVPGLSVTAVASLVPLPSASKLAVP